MVLVTGGLGYIGSHTVVSLQEIGLNTLIVDNLSNSTKNVLYGIEKACGTLPKFIEMDLVNCNQVASLFKNNKIDAIIHFAAFKSVSESVNNPVKYYDNNINSLLNLLREIEKIEKTFPFIFSSSCTVYGDSNKQPLSENSEIKKAFSPYGNTKQICEEIIIDFCKINSNIKPVFLRYFNPIGAHHSNEIGELPLGKPQNLVPFITQTVAGLHDELIVFGNDYNTHDGTNIRDYIHVVDLSNAHVSALNFAEKKMKNKYEIFNVGTGHGLSVLDVIKTFEKISGEKLNFSFGKRRNGDVTCAYANCDKLRKELGWKCVHNLDDALKSAWNWEKKIRKIG